MLLLSLLLSAQAAQPTLAERQHDALSRIIGQALTSEEAWQELVYLCDRIGHRLAGSPQLDQAIAFTKARMEEDGLDEVHLEEVQVPHWVRGHQRGELRVEDRAALPLSFLTLGNSVGTPEGGLTAEVVVVDDWEHLARLGREGVEGRIVLFDVAWSGYGETVQYRGRGPIEAAKLGAVAVMIRSVGPFSYDTPHTGATHYDDEVPPIPGVALSLENATMMRRLSEAGVPMTVQLDLGAEMRDDAVSHNVVGQITGSEFPNEVVVLGGHLDSWDVGQGAQDDGAGCIHALAALDVMRELGLTPKRTIRVVMWTNEENGLRGGSAYAVAPEREGEVHVAALESDTGSGLANGFRVDVRPRFEGEDVSVDQQRVLDYLAQLDPYLSTFGATEHRLAGSGADISPLVADGVVGFGMNHDTTGYWPIHHTEADTLDKIDPEDIKRNVAILAATAWALADYPGELRPAAEPPAPRGKRGKKR